jgi:hypothetical protein
MHVCSRRTLNAAMSAPFAVGDCEHNAMAALWTEGFGKAEVTDRVRNGCRRPLPTAAFRAAKSSGQMPVDERCEDD